MTLPQIPDVDLLSVEIEQDALDTLSYIFCEGKPFTRLVEIYTWFMAGLTNENTVREFWEEVEDLV